MGRNERAANAEALSRVFLDNLDPHHFEELMWGIKDWYSKGQDTYSIDVTDAVERVQIFVPRHVPSGTAKLSCKCLQTTCHFRPSNEMLW